MLIGAHRGAYKDEPTLDENSLSAFKRAIEFKCDYLEFDVHKTLDGMFIVYHNNQIEINNQSYIIKNSNYTNFLENVQLSLTNEQLPTLEAVVKLCKGKIKMNVEIKDPLIGKETVDYILSLGTQASDFLISSFHKQVIRDISMSYSDIERGFLFIGNLWSLNGVKFAIETSCNAIHPYYRFLTKRLMKESIKNNLKINTWTVNGKNINKFMFKENITSIMTDDVLSALELRENM
jgi:glycerophosphoryl diester phosphodiesterase